MLSSVKLMLLILVGASGPQDSVEVARIEINYVYGDNEKPSYKQLILWDFDFDYYVREFRMVRHTLDYPKFSNGQYHILSNRRIPVCSKVFIVTHNHILDDPEVKNRKLCPLSNRRPITRLPFWSLRQSEQLFVP